jgi:hypothetical protein
MSPFTHSLRLASWHTAVLSWTEALALALSLWLFALTASLFALTLFAPATGRALGPVAAVVGASGTTQGEICSGQPNSAERLAYALRLAERCVANQAERAARCINFARSGHGRAFGVTNETISPRRLGVGGAGNRPHPEARRV